LIDKDEYPKVERFAVLLSKLDQYPKELIKHLHVSEANYDRAWGLLKQRYEDALERSWERSSMAWTI
jgi:hypothetical protein